MRSRNLLFAVFFLTASIAQAQSPSLTHVFPQIADGVAGDGSVYTSRFVIAATGGSATCRVSLFGLDPSRLSAGGSILVQGSYAETITTRGEDALATGHARLDCSQPVVASVTYSILSSAKVPLGISTVPSAPAVAAIFIPVVLNGRYRYGFAVANDNDVPQLVLLLFDSGSTSLVRTIQIAPKSHYVTFMDEVFSVPATGLGSLRIAAVEGIGSDKLHAMALLFDQSGFTNVLPAILK